MNRPATLLIGLITTLLPAGIGCGKKGPAVERTKLAVFKPLPPTVAAAAGGPIEARIELGRMLYYDARLSKNQKISCNSCHDLAAYGVDGEATSSGHRGQHGDRNAPTVYNAAAQFVQFWDGRAPNVEEQAKGPVLNPVEMAMASDKSVVAVLESIPEYSAAFRRAYPQSEDPVTFENAAIAIGTFERNLLTPARWDKYLNGDEAALTDTEKEGLALFIGAGCQNCHAGALLGGNMYQKIGVMKAYPDTSDPGRFKVSKQEGDRLMFKVPTLRNIEKTGPYFHNGKVGTLPDAVAQMADFQVGRTLTDADVHAIVTFLKALTGDLPAGYIQKPQLPASTPKTPKPQEAD
jgi:cytochrome c peroxidase